MNITDDWTPVPDFPGYSINPLGQVRNDYRGSLLHTRINQYGVSYVGLMRDWRQCIRSLSRLVAETYISSPSEIFDTPINLDGDRTNCAVDNIMWRPRWYAILYVRQFEDPYDNPITTSVRAIETNEVFPNSFIAAQRYGLLEREVVLSVLNKTPTWPTYQMFELGRRE